MKPTFAYRGLSDRFKKIADNTAGVGLGFHDTMEEIYYDYFVE